MFALIKLGGFLVSPLTVSVVLGLAALALAFWRRSRLAVALGACALGLLWVCSTPVLQNRLDLQLQAPFRAIKAAQAPRADAILVLGGALAGAKLPERPDFVMPSGASRVWQAAELYRAAKAPRVFVAAGNQPDQEHLQVEADAIAQMLERLGVPTGAITAEGASRNTLENARNAVPLLRRAGARRVLLVTSAFHMQRALAVFRREAGDGIEFVPFIVDPAVRLVPGRPEVWFPTAQALFSVTRSLKEFAGIAALDII